MRNLFFCRDRRPRLSALRVRISLRAQTPFSLGRGGACSSRKSAQPPPLRTNSLSFPERGFINFSLFERKVTKEANERAARPLLRPSIVPPQATFPKICGALSDFSVPRNHKILKFCSRKDSVNLTVAWCAPDLHHAPCAPRAVWAQTGLVRGDFRPRTISILTPSGAERPLASHSRVAQRREGVE